jgi:hypothetical protein
MQTFTGLNEDFISALISDNRSTDIKPMHDIYGRLLGNWKLKMIDYYPDGRPQREHTGNWYFSRTLEGRAIQDVLVSPEFAERSESISNIGNRYGTTFRMMDPKTNQWHVDWFNPVSGIHNQLTARVDGERIIQETDDVEGLIMRWIFENITDDSFRWYGESSTDSGNTWILSAEFFAKKIKH